MATVGNFQMGTGQAAYGMATAGTDAITVNLGFKPIYVRVYNADSRLTVEKLRGNDDVDMGGGLNRPANGDAVTELGGDGISFTDSGFVIGTDCTTDNEDYMWMAFG